MRIVTLTSDYGNNSPYGAWVKAALLSQVPGVNIIDLNHAVRKHDVAQAAFFMQDLASAFPEGSVHLVAVAATLSERMLVARHRSHYYLCADNGLFSLLFDNADEVAYFLVKPDADRPGGTFPEKNIFPALVRAIMEERLGEVAEPAVPAVIRQKQMPVEEENLVRGSIVYIDGYDNAITNIPSSLFYSKLSGKASFALFYRRKQKITTISKQYTDVKEGVELALFNESGYLEIAMRTGDASQLLGLQVGAPVIIEFYD